MEITLVLLLLFSEFVDLWTCLNPMNFILKFLSGLEEIHEVELLFKLIFDI
jgi:hypothetical protein